MMPRRCTIFAARINRPVLCPPNLACLGVCCDVSVGPSVTHCRHSSVEGS